MGESGKPRISIRLAVESDSIDLLMWRNDPEAVANSINQHVVAEDQHVAWFAKALNDPRHIILVAELEDELSVQKIGVCRFLETNFEWTLSINISPSERGRGFGKAILRQSLDYLADRKGQSCDVVAFVRVGNIPSQRLFEGAGFTLCEKTSAVLRYGRKAALQD